MMLKNISRAILLVLICASFAYSANSSFQTTITGTSNVTTGNVFTYSYTGTASMPLWHLNAPRGVINKTWKTGSTFYAEIDWTSAGTAMLSFMDELTDEIKGTLNVTVTAGVPAPATTFTITPTCGTTSVARNTSPSSILEWYWQTTSSGTSTTLGKDSSYVKTSTGVLFLRSRLIASPNTWSSTSQSVGTISVNSTPPPAPASSTDAIGYRNTSISLSVAAASGATSYGWYDQSVGGTLIAETAAPTYTSQFFHTTTFYVSAKNPCESTTRRAVTVRIYDPLIVVTGNAVPELSMGNSIELMVKGTYDSYSWQNEAGQVLATTPTFVVTTPGKYKVSLTTGSTPGTSPLFTVGTALSTANMNYVSVNSYLIDNITTATPIHSLPPESVTKSTQFFDGQGRLIQTVTTQSSPNKKDVVLPASYDRYGREVTKYLPFTNGTTGHYKESALKDKATQSTDPLAQYRSGLQYAFYQNQSLIEHDQYPYAESRLENSPEARIIKQGSPGLTWQPDMNNTVASTDHTVKTQSVFNGTSEVLRWTYTPPDASYMFGKVSASTSGTAAYYPANKLMKLISRDEHQNQVIEYKTTSGLVVLKRVQLVGGNVAINDVNYASTYYIYDDRDNLVCVIQPEGTSLLPSEYFSANEASRQEFLSRWAFRYAYDSRNRMISKQIPGALPVDMIYDSRDRLVMTQDGNQRSGGLKYWHFTKYDQLNRPVLTGIYVADSVLTQAKMQRRINEYYANLATNGGAWYEKYDGAVANNVHGYTNLSYPQESNEQQYLTVSYYDNYDFKSNWIGAYQYSNEHQVHVVDGITYTQRATPFAGVIGQLTGSKIKVLDGNLSGTISGGYTWLKSVSYYDEKYRVVQTIADNYKGGYDRTTQLYDFTGKVLKSKSTHVKRAITWKNIVGARVDGNKLIRLVAGNSWGVSGASSVEVLPANTDGWMEVVVSESTSNRMIGLASSDPDQTYPAINYAVYLNSGTLKVYESNNPVYQTGTFKTGDVIRIERIGSAVKYYKNNVKFYDSQTASTSQLLVDAAINTGGSTLTNVRSSFSTLMDSTIRTFEYDHAGRLTKLWHRYNGGTNYLLTKNEYNELGQLVDKKLHSTDANATTAKQSVDMRYNIRGWLTSINNATLVNDGNTNDDTGDFYGMNMAYEHENASLGNSAMYNGNISAIQWSKDLGLNTNVKEQAYVYSYDALNRLNSATHKLSPSTNTWNTGKFNEDGLTYDLNGNIKTLNRTSEAVDIDKLVYNYGTGSTQSNQLLGVADQTSVATNKAKGFVDSPTTGNDYTYDVNGNMTRDLNKGIGINLTDATNIITYNFLNLPETVTKGSSSIRYIYDASGRKLAQLVTFNNATTNRLTDYAGEHVYENNVLQFVNHEEGRIVLANEKLIYSNKADALTEFTAVNSPTLSIVNQNDNQNYLKVVSTGTVAGTGVTIGSPIIVDGGVRYKIKVKGYRERAAGTTSSLAGISAKLNGVSVSTSNSVLPVKGGATLVESWVEQIVAVPVGAQQQLQIGVTWPTVTTGEIFWINDVEVIKLEAQAPEYQYFLKDHLGNVRLTFTTKQETDANIATLEAANTATESAQFLRYSNARIVNHYLFDKTNGSSPTTTNGGAQRLSGQGNEVYGLGKSISVMPGDVINMEVYGKYIDSNSANRTEALNTLISQIAGGTASAGTVVDGSAYPSSTSSFPFAAGQNGTTTSSGTGPKAYLNWLVFDRKYNLIAAKSDYRRMSTAARETGQDAAHEKLNGSVTISEAGYVYVYLSNEEGANAYEVYFDEFKVEHIKSPVIQMEDYYPFGLTYNSYSRENAAYNSCQYNGKEKQDELDLNWLDYGARMYMAEIGRWGVSDPLSEKLKQFSPYCYSFNNPSRFLDPDGRFPFPFIAAVGYYIASKVMERSEGNSRVREIGYGMRHPINAAKVNGPFITNHNDVTTNFQINIGRAANLPNGDGSPQNAIRHTLWQAITASDIGERQASRIANAHETTTNVNLDQRKFEGTNAMANADRVVDLLNNRIGREIGVNNPDAENTELALAVINEYHENGLWTVSGNAEEGFTIRRTPLSDEQFQAATREIQRSGQDGLHRLERDEE